MVGGGLTVLCDKHSVGELAASQALHGLLTAKHLHELHEDLSIAKDLHALHGPGDELGHPVLAALIPNILHDLLIQQQLRAHQCS